MNAVPKRKGPLAQGPSADASALMRSGMTPEKVAFGRAALAEYRRASLRGDGLVVGSFFEQAALSAADGVQQAILEVKRSVENREIGYRAGLAQELAKCVEIALFLRSDLEQWERLRMQSDEPEPLDPNSEAHRSAALRSILTLAFNPKERIEKQRVSMFYRALAPSMRDGIDPDQLPKIIAKAGGLKALAAQNVTSGARRHSTPPPRQKPNAVKPLVIENSEDVSSDDEKAPSDGEVMLDMDDPDRHLSLFTTFGAKTKSLLSLEKGGRASIMFDVEETEGDCLFIKVVSTRLAPG